MAHAWQQHFGNPGRRGYHNEEWADKMESIGLMPSSTGKLGGSRTGEKMADYAIKGGLFMQATDKLLAAGCQASCVAGGGQDHQGSPSTGIGTGIAQGDQWRQ